VDHPKESQQFNIFMMLYHSFSYILIRVTYMRFLFVLKAFGVGNCSQGWILMNKAFKEVDKIICELVLNNDYPNMKL